MIEDKNKWSGAKTRLIKKVWKSRAKSIYYSGDMSDSAWELLEDGYLKSTRFGFGNYELTDKGKKLARELCK